MGCGNILPGVERAAENGAQQPEESERQAALSRALDWAGRRSYDGSRWSAAQLRALRGERKVSVVIPVKDAAPTVGRVAASCVRLREAGAVSEVVVVDAASADGSAGFAEEAGATVVQESDLLPQFGDVEGKGDALWRTLSIVDSEFVVFVDADTEAFSESFVCGLVGPLLEHDELVLVKGAFDRPFTSGGMRIEGGGGRVNELVARPLLNAFFPELAALRQPLAGELAARRDALVELPFRTGYGVEIALLIDVWRRHGLDAIAQSDLGERLNRHQHLHELAPMAWAVQRALLERVEGGPPPAGDAFVGWFGDGPQLRTIGAHERPPLAELVDLKEEP